MKKNFVEELYWRGMLHSMTPGTEEQLEKEMTTGYLGIDPTADSLHIGHLCGIMMLRHFQRAGHKPLALLGGATGMIGDPSGKSAERVLLTDEILNYNQMCIKKQLSKFLDFESDAPNKAELVNNYDWMRNYSFLNFIRDIGKHITVNYMMAKDSVKKRFSGEGEGMSFTEFSYQLVQGYDFLYLYQNKKCKLQLGGSDQWGNITTGTELIRRRLGADETAYALTCPLITKADGGKFGKTEKGNIWLDPAKTSPYAFYQFWMNCSDDDAAKYIKIFTLLSKEEIDDLIKRHEAEPHLRELQRTLAREITIMVHSKEDLEIAEEATQILFGKGTSEALHKFDEATLLSILDGVPQAHVAKSSLEAGMPIVDFLTQTEVFSSKGEARKMLQGNGVSINKEKVAEADVVNKEHLLNDKYILVQKGKKNYYLIIAD